MKKFIAITLTVLTGCLMSGVICVDRDAAGANNGSSWTDAYVSLYTALTASVSGDEIWVAEGVYYASSGFFDLKSDVGVYGGFNGTETLLSERDWQSNRTVLSGDIGQDDVNTDGNFIAETWADIAGTNAVTVVRANSVSSLTRLDGFVITAGSMSSSNGAGILDYIGSANYYNLEIRGNQSKTDGAGVFCNRSSAHFENVVFDGNRIYDYAYGQGGGLFCYDSDLTVKGCTFNNNSAPCGGGFGVEYSTINIEDAIFSNNITPAPERGIGGGMYINEESGATIKMLLLEKITLTATATVFVFSIFTLKEAEKSQKLLP